MREIETDYLIVGAGASGMAVADELVANTDAEIVLVDRRHRPGGHWNEGYGFLRLHQPSAYYGVSSRELGNNRVDTSGPNAGFYERATGAEVFDYYGRVLDEQMLPTGRVRFFGMTDYVGSDADGYGIRSRLTGEVATVRVRRKLVDATLLQTTIAPHHTPAFGVDPDVRVVIPHDLSSLWESGTGFTVIGAGKTSMDTCTWLLEQGVDPDRIRWIRPRDAWTIDRARMQPLALIGQFAEWFAVQMEAAAEAKDAADFLHRLEESGGHGRLDPSVEPRVYRGATLSEVERQGLRSIENVIRMGRVLHVGAHETKLEDGSIASNPGHIYIDCSAPGIGLPPVQPMFQPGVIRVQRAQVGIDPFCAALVGFVEATRDDDRDKNRLCPPVDAFHSAAEFTPSFLHSQRARVTWFTDPDVRDWLARTRLTPLRNAADYLPTDPAATAAVGRMIRMTGPAIENLERITATSA